MKLSKTCLTLIGFTFLATGVRIVWGLEEHTVVFEEVYTFRPKRILITVGPDNRVLMDDRNPKPPPPTHSKWWIKGTKYRQEARQGDKQRLYIENSDGNFQLDCDTKTGGRVPASDKPEESVSRVDPTRMFALYKRKWKNFTKEGSEEIDGQKCDRYRAVSYQQTARSKVKNTHHLWVRQSDNVVLKIETENEYTHGVHEYKNIKIGVPIPDSLFEVSKGYKIEDRTPKR